MELNTFLNLYRYMYSGWHSLQNHMYTAQAFRVAIIKITIHSHSQSSGFKLCTCGFELSTLDSCEELGQTHLTLCIIA